MVCETFFFVSGARRKPQKNRVGTIWSIRKKRNVTGNPEIVVI